MRHVIKLNKVLNVGNTLAIIQGNKVLKVVVLGVENAPQGLKNTYWIGVCLK